MGNKIQMIPDYPYPLGVHKVRGGLHVSYPMDCTKECGIILYPGMETEKKIIFSESCMKGNLYSLLLLGEFVNNISYQLFCGDQLVDDIYARNTIIKRKWNEEEKEISCIKNERFEWSDGAFKSYTFQERIFYMLHVMGYTKHRSSGNSKKGTFAGLKEKITYWKDLGITSLIFMPVYDFCEKETSKINFWGYTKKSHYYRPKAAYAYTSSPVKELKDFINELHINNLEFFMQFYFPETMSIRDKLDILIFWKEEYHIDGVELIGSNELGKEIDKEPALCGLPYLLEDVNSLNPVNSLSGYMNEQFLYNVRCFLKGDNFKIQDIAYLMRDQRLVQDNPKPLVHYLAKQNSMRLYDCVAYNEKHNQENGENNQDGTDYNCSWNCGVEGKTRKKEIINLRQKQMKNALCLLFLAQGTPLIYGGDEWGNTQYGNNNPYCQDNDISYLKWNFGELGNDLISFVKELINIRQKYSIFHMKKALTGQDILNTGYPDISVHGDEAWKLSGNVSGVHHMGILYNAYYGDSKCKELLYLAINMHWEPHVMALPRLSKGEKWESILSTDQEKIYKKNNKDLLEVPARSVVLVKAEYHRN